MAELTKTDTRQSLGKIIPTDKMVMMPGLFDGTKPENQNSTMRDLICTIQLTLTYSIQQYN